MLLRLARGAGAGYVGRLSAITAVSAEREKAEQQVEAEHRPSAVVFWRHLRERTRGWEVVIDSARIVFDPGMRRSGKQYACPAWGRDLYGDLWVRCVCGLAMSLDHEVAADGTITPSIHHDDSACGWHVHGILLDYVP